MYTVLLADDEPLAVEWLKLAVDWQKHGFQVVATCGDGEEAFRYIDGHRPDIVVTDIRMPIKDGLCVIEDTRRSGNESTLFVITSGFSDFEYARQAIRLGVSHYLTKPVIGSEAEQALGRLREELQERAFRQFVHDSARRYRIGEKLAVLLRAGEEGSRGRDPVAQELADLSGQADAWTYMRVETGGMPIEDALRAAEQAACCYPVDIERNAFGLVVGVRGADAQEIERATRALAEKLAAAMKAAGTGRVGIAAGCCVDDLEKIRESYASAAEAGRILFFSRQGIVHYADVRRQTLSADAVMFRTVDEIVRLVADGGPDALETAVRHAYRAFEERLTAPELVRVFETRIVLRCISVYKEFGGDPQDLGLDHDADNRLLHGWNLQDCADKRVRFCLHVQTAVTALREKHTGGTQSKVAEYLRQHYKETHTIKQIADRYFMHPVYLGQSFAQRYGVSILDYVHDFRIEEAKRLLLETDAASGAIATRVGYQAYHHFLRQFVKRTGMKPGDYRHIGETER